MREAYRCHGGWCWSIHRTTCVLCEVLEHWRTTGQGGERGMRRCCSHAEGANTLCVRGSEDAQGCLELSALAANVSHVPDFLIYLPDS